MGDEAEVVQCPFKLLMIVYKCINNIAPSYLSELLLQYSPTRTLRSGNKQLLQEAKSNRSWGDRSFAIGAPRLWNELPFNIRTAKSITVFKKNSCKHTLCQKHFLRFKLYFHISFLFVFTMLVCSYLCCMP